MTTQTESSVPTNPAGPAGQPGEPGGRRRPRGRWVVLGLAVIAFGVFFFLTRDSGGDVEPIPDSAQGSEPGLEDVAGGLPDGYVTYRDAETGFSLAHPESWIQIVRPNGTERLRLNAGGMNGMLVRVQPTEQPITNEEDLEQVRPVTDGLAASSPEVQVLQQDTVTINGMPGFFYLSRLTDQESGTTAVNAHYFLFKGRTMNIILFQAAPETEFERLAPDFDRVLASFQSDAEVAPPAEEQPPADGQPPAGE